MTGQRGFSLIELSAVLVILALLSAVVGLSLASVSRQTDVRNAVAAVADLDRTMRIECMDFERTGSLNFDLEEGVIKLVVVRDGEPVDVQAYKLPVAMRIQSVRQVDSEHQRRDSNPVIPCDNRGQTPTYVLTIRHDTEEGDQQTQVAVAGLTGQFTEMKDAVRVDNLFTALASGHTD